jgi:hypothetical protein
LKKVFIFIILFFFLNGCKVSVEQNSNRGLIIPAYFYDSTLWNETINADINEIVIVNPANGPGIYVDSNYKNYINELINNGKKPIGYVYTKWGERNLSDVESDIDMWITLYPQIKGFFIDEASSEYNMSGYYDTLYRYIKAKGDYFVVLNPGTKPDSVYYSMADDIVVYEGNASSVPSDACQFYSDKSSVIVYDANETQMREIINSHPCKYLYITDKNASYNSLPSYFSDEINYLK